MDDLEIIILSEVNQKEKDKYHMISLVCEIFKNDTNELIKEKQTQTSKTNLRLPMGKCGRGGTN